MGWTPPTPPPGRDPRPLNPAKSGPPKGRIFPDFWGLRCSAQGGWGGSAHYPDPTAQSAPPPARRSTRRSRPRPGPAGALRGPKNRKKFSFFLRKVVFVSGWTNGGVAIGCADVAVGGGRGRRLPQWLSSARLGVGPYRARSPRLGRSPALAVSQPTGGRGRHSEGSGRVWLSQTASPSPHLRHPCAGLPSLALREVLFRMATYPPPALKRRWRVPSQPCSLTAPAHV